MRGFSAVYLIEADSKFYVGASRNLWERWADHIRGLTARTHRNPEMQAIFDALGIAAFQFRILETVARADLGSREQFWLDHYRLLGKQMFNTSPIAKQVGAWAPGRMKGSTMSVEHRAKIAAAQAAAWARDDGSRKAVLVHRNRTSRVLADLAD